MHRRPTRLIAALAALAAGPALASAGDGDGLVEVPLTVANEGAGAIGCRAAIAHWFSADLGTAAAGEAVEAVLWTEPATGAVFLINAAGDRMPVESLWCGVAGATWRTRSLIPLPRRAAAGERLSLTCRGAADEARLACRRERPAASAGGD